MQERITAILALVTALTITGIAAWFSVIGIISIFPGAALAVAIMGGALEFGKIVAATWLKINWRSATFLVKSYLLSSVFVLMVITSMGIFGFLSKAHVDQAGPITDNAAKIERIKQRIEREQRAITDSETMIDQLDETVNTLIEFDKISGEGGAREVRESQAEQRQQLNTQIDEAQNNIDRYLDESFELEQTIRDFEVEVGPIKYIAELLYSNSEKDVLEKAVTFVILMLVFVFDPFAVALLVAATENFRNISKNKVAEKQVIIEYRNPIESENDNIIEPDPEPEPEPPKEDPKPEEPQDVEKPQQTSYRNPKTYNTHLSKKSDRPKGQSIAAKLKGKAKMKDEAKDETKIQTPFMRVSSIKK